MSIRGFSKYFPTTEPSLLYTAPSSETFSEQVIIYLATHKEVNCAFVGHVTIKPGTKVTNQFLYRKMRPTLSTPLTRRSFENRKKVVAYLKAQGLWTGILELGETNRNCCRNNSAELWNFEIIEVVERLIAKNQISKKVNLILDSDRVRAMFCLNKRQPKE